MKPAPGAREEDEIDLAAPANEPLLNPVVVYPVERPDADRARGVGAATR